MCKDAQEKEGKFEGEVKSKEEFSGSDEHREYERSV